MKRSYGFMIERDLSNGTEYVKARVMVREGNLEYPINPSSDGEQAYEHHATQTGLMLDGLTIYGHVYERDLTFIMSTVKYTQVYYLELPVAEKAVKTLRRIEARIQKDAAREPGDVYSSVAAALGLTFAVERVGRRETSSYRDSDWNWMTIQQGRNLFRRHIEMALDDARKRVQPAA